MWGVSTAAAWCGVMVRVWLWVIWQPHDRTELWSQLCWGDTDGSAWLDACQCVCLLFWSYCRYRHAKMYLSQCLMGACLSYTYARTHTVNKLVVRHGAVISALVPHHLLLMVVINWWMRSNRRYPGTSQFGYNPFSSRCSPLCHPPSCFLNAQCTTFPLCSSA